MFRAIPKGYCAVNRGSGADSHSTPQWARISTFAEPSSRYLSVGTEARNNQAVSACGDDAVSWFRWREHCDIARVWDTKPLVCLRAFPAFEVLGFMALMLLDGPLDVPIFRVLLSVGGVLLAGLTVSSVPIPKLTGRPYVAVIIVGLAGSISRNSSGDLTCVLWSGLRT